MNILETLVQLRDDIKTWVTNNLQALNTKIDEKTIPVDSELSTTSVNPVQSKVIVEALAGKQPAGDYALKSDVENIQVPNSNLVNGSAEGSIRSFYSAEESEDYIIGEGSFALGYGSQVPASNAFALGSGCLIEGGGSVAEGSSNYIYGESAHAEGTGTSALSEFSHAEGTETLTRGYAAHAEGGRNAAFGAFSHTEGEGTAASGDVSHAEGYGERIAITVSNYGSGAVYQYSGLEDPSILKVGMIVSLTEPFVPTESEMRRGANKIVSIDTSAQTFTLKNYLSSGTPLVNQTVYLHVSGIAYGEGSHVEGGFNIAAGATQHVEGYCNAADPLYDYTNPSSRGKYIHITGNGAYDARSNAHALDWNGNAYYAGNVYVAGDGKNDFSGAKKLATEDFVTAALTALGLPVPTAADAGKILRVNAQGKYELVAIANAEEATF